MFMILSHRYRSGDHSRHLRLLFMISIISAEWAVHLHFCVYAVNNHYVYLLFDTSHQPWVIVYMHFLATTRALLCNVDSCIFVR